MTQIKQIFLGGKSPFYSLKLFHCITKFPKHYLPILPLGNSKWFTQLPNNISPLFSLYRSYI